MSAPARHLATPPPRTTRRTDGAQRPRRSQTRRAAPPRPRSRGRHHLGFWVLASTLVGSMVFGIVVLNVLLAQASFRIDEVERRIETLSAEQVELVREQATLSAPGRIAHWASRHGMRLPDDIRILHPSGGTWVDPAGADPSNDASDAEATLP